MVPDRLIRCKSDEVAVDQGCWFDQQAADRVRFFFKRFLRHSKGQFAGCKFELLPWQWERVIEPAFGWKAADGTRRFRKVACGIAKKNGKSTLLSGIGLYLLAADNEPSAEVYVAGADRDQASIIYNEALSMVKASDALHKRIRLRPAKKEMEYGNSLYRALSSEANTKEGFNIHGLLFDELHAQKTPELWDTLKYGGAARRQPMIFWISTAGVDRESVCYLQWKAAKDVQESRAVDTSLLPCIYETDEGDDPWNEETWMKANPSYGVTITRRDMQQAADEARNNPAEENSFRRYRLNQWTRQVSRWISVEKWDKCRSEYVEDDLKRSRVYLGLDLASTTDLVALAGLAEKPGEKPRTFFRFWAPETVCRVRERSNRQRIDHWAQAGYIKLTHGDSADYSVIRSDINAIGGQFRVKELGIDPWNATSLAQDLAADGIDVQFVRQGFATMSPACKELEKLVLNGGIEHDGNPVASWCFNNMAVALDSSGNVKPDKAKSSEKIDGIVALLIALALSIKAQREKRSVYDARKVLII